MSAKGPKIGSGHMEAWLRAGLKEVAQSLPAFPQSIKSVEEPGLWGNPVQQEVYAQKQAQKQGPEPEQEMEMGM